MTKNPVKANAPIQTSSRDDVNSFLAEIKAKAPVSQSSDYKGRLIFALDATMSRQHTWDQATQIQVEMFKQAAQIGGMDIQLVYFRGYDECRASKWASDAKTLGRLMTKVDCRGGHTQINKVLHHVRRETNTKKVDAVVLVGDCMEENIDDICQTAGQVGLAGVPVFVFQEGYDAPATKAFKEVARLTRGAHCRFDPGSVDQLRQLLQAVAAYAAGGRKALTALSSSNSQSALLLEQLK